MGAFIIKLTDAESDEVDIEEEFHLFFHTYYEHYSFFQTYEYNP